MAKKKTSIFMCSNDNCDYKDHKFFGLCPKCKAGHGEENEFKDENTLTIKGKENTNVFNNYQKRELKKIDEIEKKIVNRYDLNLKQLNQLFGGTDKKGIAENSVVLLSGHPGVGKSTLLLQIIDAISKQGKKCGYFSSEESEIQIKDRYTRLNKKESFYISNDEDMLQILIDSLDLDFMIIDSINTMYIEGYGVPGGVSQVKECTMQLMKHAKNKNKTIIIVGQINGEGDIAGPKTLEHMVDTVLFFEDFDNTQKYKILSSNKNRFGKSNESVIMEMQEDGLHEVLNPSLLFIEDDDETIGASTSLFLKGNRPIFLQIESLISHSNFEKTIIQALGLDQKKLFQLNAVMSKYLDFSSFNKNIFCQVVGGLNITKESNSHLDLSIIASILSSEKNINLNDYIFIGEASLSGKIRKANREDELIKYCNDMGINKKIICKSKGFNKIEDLLSIFE